MVSGIKGARALNKRSAQSIGFGVFSHYFNTLTTRMNRLGRRYTKPLRAVAAVMIVLILSGCSTTPSVPSVVNILPPNISDFAKPVVPPVRLSVRDQRTHNHVLRIEHHSDHAEFATTQVPLATLMSEVLLDFWPHAEDSAVPLTVYLEDALVRVIPTEGGYRAEHRVAMRVVARSGMQWIGRQYVTQAEGGPYRQPDFEQITDTFNRAVHTTLRDMMSDQVLQEWLQNHVQ
ncbi:hypothetical protein CWE08_10300 [Aliidiomarina iranensis]|uniref:ABC-type transport auxiliary lipoprotein component domain-containing protein n=1 Tax=Aliidiomarina iranensis TaxID=1434071 RepID=A0A432VSP7_9GAMM|nr:YajG family lipoprotein [Aliidiomarina iranensis]RUO19356.1 hypothetical protein CWE08_10300 [Aliidiomarina iranensis]